MEQPPTRMGKAEDGGSAGKEMRSTVLDLSWTFKSKSQIYEYRVWDRDLD